MQRGWGPPTPGRRPPWWPEGESFPPRRWGRRGPPGFVRRIGCFFVAILACAVLAGAVVGGLIAKLGGWPVAGLALVLVLLLVVAVFGAVRRMTRPMTNLIDAAQRIESGDYTVQVPESGPRDLRSVARAFNEMSARLNASDVQRRSFLAELAHEFRTPLTVIRGQAEAIGDGVYPGDASHLAPILDATETLDRLVEDLRTLVLTDAGSLVLHKEPTDLGALAADTVETFKTQADAVHVTLSSDAGANLEPVDLDPARIRSVLGNLLSNAIRHTPPGGAVKVTVNGSGDSVALTVTDTGDGIAAELLPRVFERFVKGASSPGSGLGLAIARDIVAAHSGKLEIQSTDGSGTAVQMTLPKSGGD
jgi:signal transduction histidine kinase